MQLDTARFLRDLDELRTIGTYRTGVHRPTFSPQDMESRHWLARRMEEVGLDASIDGIGNVFGRHRGAGPHLLAGSHIETQNHAGWLDGALGVIAALALARAGLPVDVCAYADEEGHWGDFLGSRSLVGDLTEAQIDAARNRTTGATLRDALAEAGLAGRPRLLLEDGRYRGALELHIEQGTQLENAGLRLGVVTGIVGIRQWRIVIEGQQDHTGGTTMRERRDAGLTAVRLLAAVDQEFPKVCAERSVWTTGRILLDPNMPQIIPGRAEITFSFRDLSVEVMDRMEACLHHLVWESNRRERCTARLEFIGRTEPSLSDPGLLAALEGAAESLCPGAWQAMPSGAIHDSQILSRKLPVAMLFTPSIGGISHHWSEDTKREDLELGVRVLAEGASRFLMGN
ncbi:Zn-dependent hydrolase [Paracraurococcus ruber]|uniref:Zn-dependent hydrolase n=1 Tax=Paracraurococcus ruber TaxID=77675 RepID=A0ABS1D108_9PROT|nr:Zn-dependent hydrolase [Paracraurococcus ruber]MBK1660241.1 Zn-dependent hydrolase [Paracraurococcus ruber]TDG31868.1 Zn-dependent hydrolase [Paracraurococcus ruber]